MEKTRLDPDRLLQSIQNKEKENNRGRLKIFFGYAAGVGKTYAMLKSAHTAKEQGVDVVVGYVEPHARPETSALVDGLEVIPTAEVQYSGTTQKEFDIDAALERKPKLILVDELAHTNVPGSRHTKRYQDIQEILNSGIDVYTTVNVQHIESLNDLVAAITGVFVRERIPDIVFDSADQVALVDIEPEDLIKRLNAGVVYREEQAERAKENFFTVENLTALREIALRRCADRINLLVESARAVTQSDYHTDEHIMVCLSPSASNAKVIRTAVRMASAFKANLTAVFVETPEFETMSEQDVDQLRKNMRLAQQLGATIETVFGEDVAFQIAEFARLSGISKLVMGRSGAVKRYIWSKPSLTEQLIVMAPNLEIHIIADNESGIKKYRAVQKKSSGKTKAQKIPLEILKSVAVLFSTTVVGLLLENMGLNGASVIIIYILGVQLISIITSNWMCSLLSSLASVLIFNFFFIDPLYSFVAYDISYPVTFIIMFTVAFITGTFAIKLKSTASQSARSAFRTKILFETNQLMQKANTSSEIFTATANQLSKLLNRTVILYQPMGDFLDQPRIFEAGSDSLDEVCISKNEQAVANWVYKNNKRAGATTDTLSSAKCLYLAIRKGDMIYGVIGIVMEEKPLESFEDSIVLSILGESALALENEKSMEEKEKTAILAENEQLRANLLRAISHDLRTPLTSISGNANNLLSNSVAFSEETKLAIYSDIYDDSLWLIELVENLLSASRLEGSEMQIRKTTELVEDVVEEALRHASRESVNHTITVENKEEFLLAQMDAKLIVQVIINIVNNAIKYTQDGSTITITTCKEGENAVIQIADTGDGISDEIKPHVFDMFYSGSNKIVDSRRSLGLGLSLCRSIVAAHKGSIWVEDNSPKGAKFIIILPAEEVDLYE